MTILEKRLADVVETLSQDMPIPYQLDELKSSLEHGRRKNVLPATFSRWKRQKIRHGSRTTTEISTVIFITKWSLRDGSTKPCWSNGRTDTSGLAGMTQMSCTPSTQKRPPHLRHQQQCYAAVQTSAWDLLHLSCKTNHEHTPTIEHSARLVNCLHDEIQWKFVTIIKLLSTSSDIASWIFIVPNSIQCHVKKVGWMKNKNERRMPKMQSNEKEMKEI